VKEIESLTSWYVLNRFIRLANEFLQGKCLPFLGAGVSNDATFPCDDPPPIKVDCMCKKLVDYAWNRLCNGQKKRVLELLNVKDNSVLNNAEEASKKIGLQLGKLCEVLQYYGISFEKIVKELEISKLAKLEPTPAHYYIAFLVRETLVNEVITTNYDCCMERALHYVANEKPEPKAEEKKRAFSIYNLATYRAYGSRRLFPYNADTILRVYKINGCADALARKEASPESILLTEKQLQHMDDRAWARDLLKDRIRSRTIVFSGFGSEEPQIRFTVLRLLEEFSEDYSNQGKHSSENHIWFQVYKTSTFSQMQILYGYLENERKNGLSFETASKKCIFTGDDRESIFKLLGENPGENNKEKLPADIFWKVIFLLVFLALVNRYTNPESNFWKWFSDLDDNPRPVLRRTQFLECIDPQGIGEKVLAGKTISRKDAVIASFALKNINEIFGYKKNILNSGNAKIEGIPFCLWLRALMGKPPPLKVDCYYPPETYYLPLIKQRELVLALLATFYFLGSGDFKVFSIEKIELNDYKQEYLLAYFKGLKVLLKSKDLARESNQNIKKVFENRNIIVAFLPYKPKELGETEFFAYEDKDKNKIFIGQLLNISVTKLIEISFKNKPKMNNKVKLTATLLNYLHRREERYHAPRLRRIP